MRFRPRAAPAAARCRPGRRRRITLHAADADKVGARRDRLDDVAARRIEPSMSTLARRRLRPPPRQDVHGAAAVIELAAAMVRR